MEPQPNQPMVTGILTAAPFTPAGQDFTPDGESPTRAPRQHADLALFLLLWNTQLQKPGPVTCTAWRGHACHKCCWGGGMR